MEAQVFSINKRIEEQAHEYSKRKLSSNMAKMVTYRKILEEISCDTLMVDGVSQALIEGVRKNMMDAYLAMATERNKR